MIFVLVYCHNLYFEFLISVLFIVYSHFIWYYVTFHGSVLPISKQDYFLLSLGFMIWIGLSIITLAWFYHVKFTKNEEDLLKYNDKLKAMTKSDTLTKLLIRTWIFDS